MKKLLLAIVLGLTMAIPATSYAGPNAMGVRLPVDTTEPKNNVESGYVPETAAGSYVPQQLDEEAITYENERYRLSAFGVDIESLREG